MAKEVRVLACVNGPNCVQKCPQKVLDAFVKNAAEQGVSERFEVMAGACVGMCLHGPNMRFLTPHGRFAYCRLKPEDAKELVDAHKGDDDRAVERLLLKF